MLTKSFVHNVIIHPLLFIADTLDRIFGPNKASDWLDRLHR